MTGRYWVRHARIVRHADVCVCFGSAPEELLRPCGRAALVAAHQPHELASGTRDGVGDRLAGQSRHLEQTRQLWRAGTGPGCYREAGCAAAISCNFCVSASLLHDCMRSRNARSCSCQRDTGVDKHGPLACAPARSQAVLVASCAVVILVTDTAVDRRLRVLLAMRRCRALRESNVHFIFLSLATRARIALSDYVDVRLTWCCPTSVTCRLRCDPVPGNCDCKHKKAVLSTAQMWQGLVSTRRDASAKSVTTSLLTLSPACAVEAVACSQSRAQNIQRIWKRQSS